MVQQMTSLFLLLGFALLILRQLAVQLRFWNLDKLCHEGLESTERGVWGGFRAGLHPVLLYYQKVREGGLLVGR